ncbi:MAG: 2,3-bisphosphoglycerate-independent phosphoglycerate mutase [Burkholderiales bacterium]|nr:2,3-bisphosphoglycerate-independent phosphoglycerate mutase [Burkholderiales bacterium]
MKLEPNPRRPAPSGPVVFLVLDGVGIGCGDEFDAVHVARTPTLDRLRREGVWRTLRAHGKAVGLPSDADIGNSEVGHNILGAGRVFPQGASSVETAFANGAIWQGAWRRVADNARREGATLHFIGLLSDGNVHAHQRHLEALLERAAAEGVRRLRVHALLDGRDVPDHSAERYLGRLEERLERLRESGTCDARIASCGGRMVTTMDRYEADWRIVEAGWRVQVLGEGRKFPGALAGLSALRAEQPGLSDQVVPPFVVADAAGHALGPIVDGDSVVLFNFRGDRAIEVSLAFESDASFDRVERVRVPRVCYAGMMLYDGDRHIPAEFLVSPATVSDTLSECLAQSGCTQFACAETQKYGHITYFWNGNRSSKFSERNEVYLEIPSDRVPFDQRPWMKSAETADAVIAAIDAGRARFVRANFAAGDMVGHTGNLDAAVIAVEALDLSLARVAAAVQRRGGVLVVTADHGNADDMVERDADGRPLRTPAGVPIGRTSHTRNPVPFIVWRPAGSALALRDDLPEAGLANVAATLMELLGYVAPASYEPSLLAAPAG